MTRYTTNVRKKYEGECKALNEKEEKKATVNLRQVEIELNKIEVRII